MPHPAQSGRIGKETADVVFRHTIVELALLAVLVLVPVGSLILLRRYPKTAGQAPGPSEGKTQTRLPER